MNEVEYSELLTEVQRDAETAAWQVGFLKACLDESDLIASRLNRSFAGRAGVTARFSVYTGVVLYLGRAWDQGKDALSVRRAFCELPPLEMLEARRASQIEGLGITEYSASLKERYERLSKSFETADSNHSQKHIRLIRSEHFAHRVLESRDRKKLQNDGIRVNPATYNDLIEVAEATLNLVGQISYLWTREANPFPDKISHATHWSAEFWRHLPIYSEVERELER